MNLLRGGAANALSVGVWSPVMVDVNRAGRI